MINYKKYNHNIINDMYKDYYMYIHQDETDEQEVLEIMLEI